MKPGFDHQHLRIFAVLARQLNMRRAADELCLTASGVSRGLAALELSWGCRLFDRSPRRMTLTRAGRELLPLAESVLDRWGPLEEKLKSAATPAPRQLRVVVSPTIGQYILPAALREFRETCPEWTVKITFGRGRDAERSARENQIDLGITVQPVASGGYDFEVLAEDELQFVVHPLHPWAVERRVRIEDLAQARRTLILPERGDETCELIEAYLREDGVVVEPGIEITGEESIKHFVRLDLGVGILPRWIIADELQRGELTTLPLGRRRLRRPWGVLNPSGRPLEFAGHVFANLCGAALRARIEAASQSSS